MPPAHRLPAAPAALLLLLAGLMAPARAPADASPLAETGAQRSLVASPQDRSFINLYLRAGLAASEAGQLAVRRARDPGVRRLGEAQVDAFRAAARQLEDMVAPLGLPPLPREPDAEHKAAADLLREAGPATFDRQFLEQQLRDQEDLLQVLGIEAGTGDNPGLRNFATQERERLLTTYQHTRILADQLPTAASVTPSSPGPD